MTIETVETAEEQSLRERLARATELLAAIDEDRGVLAAIPAEEYQRFMDLMRRVSNPDHASRRKLVKALARERKAARLRRDEEVLGSTGIRELRRKPVFTTPNDYLPGGFDDRGNATADESRTSDTRHCYVCKQHFDAVHHFYDQLCPSCAELNFRKRTESADLSGRVALLTGGRVKIGYQAGLKLLRAGASLIVTTRFPRDSAARYAKEPDFEQWSDRLEIFGLDLRHTPSVEAFCHHLMTTRERLDFIVNNACQTVRRPPGFYEHMMERERAVLDALDERERHLLGAYEGLRGYQMLPEQEQTALAPGGVSAVTGLTHAAEPRRLRCFPRTTPRGGTSSRKDGSTRTCSRLTCAAATPGVCCWRRSPRWSSWKCNWSTRSRPSSSMRVSSRSCCGPRTATSTSSTSPRWRGSSTGTTRPRGIRTRTWPRRR